MGCTRPTGESSQISIQFPGSLSSSKALGRVVASTSASFDSTPPTSLADIDCYAVFVGADEEGMQESSCTNGDGDKLFNFGPSIGVFEPGTTATLEVKSGSKRRIMVAGMHKLSGNCESPNLRDITVSNYSYPYLLSSITRDLAPGNVKVDMVLTADFTSPKKLASCSFFSAGGGGGGGGGTPSSPPYRFMLTATPTAIGSVVIPLDSIPHDAITNVTLQVVDQQNRAVAQGSGISVSLSLGYPLLTFDGTSSTTSVVLDGQGQSTFSIHVGNNEMVTTLTASFAGSIPGVPSFNTLVLPVGPYTGEPSYIHVHTMMANAGAAIGQCLPVQYSIGGGPTGVLHPSAVNIVFQPTSSSGSFYSAPDCTGAVAASVTIPSGKVMAYLYFMPSTSGVVSFGMSGSPVNASASPLSLYGTPTLYIP